MPSPTITVVVPTIRENCWKEFFTAWEPLFEKHSCTVLRVVDGDDPTCEVVLYQGLKQSHRVGKFWKRSQDPLRSAIVKFSPACRNLGFSVLSHNDDLRSDVVMTFDDDTLPYSDTIRDHLNALKMRTSLDWASTASHRMRGYPIGEWSKHPVMLSHGYWVKVPDLDAPTQMVMSEAEIASITRTEGVIQRGMQFPMCGMNLAFRKELLPYMYFAPVVNLPGAQRFDDIWCGLYLKREMDRLDYAAVTGFASVVHTRASNVFKNLQQEAVGIEINESLWRNLDCPPEKYSKWFEDYAAGRKMWADGIKAVI